MIAEFLEYVKGEKAEKDIFEGVNTSWSRVKGGSKVQTLVTNAIQSFDAENPSASVRSLFQIRKEILNLENGIWKTRKLKEVEQLIQDCLGLFMEVKADQYWISPTGEVVTNFELVNRSGTEVILQQIKSEDLQMDSTLSLPLNKDAAVLFKSNRILNASKSYSDPYWLQQPHGLGLFTVKNKSLIGNRRMILPSTSLLN